jgi:VWFA-related protein
MESLSDAIQDAMPSGSGASTAAESIASIQQFEAEQNALQTRLRVLNTLDAFNTLAHYLSNFSGRKNLIWFSGSFPLEINPDPTAGIAAFRNVDDWNTEYRETENLLSTSQTAVYPVDARGLMTNPALQASNARTNYKWSNPSAFNNVLTGFTLSQAEEHATMERLASDTGGRAFYNTNDLADAVGKALDEGSNYYTVTYTPTDHNWNGAYRNIRIELAGYPAASGYKLSYRRGYNADDPQKLPKAGASPMKTATADAATPVAPVDHAAEAYSRAAISRGAPMPSDILFKVRILPLTGKDEDAVAPDNRADPNGRMKRPYRTFAVDYVALPGEFVTMPQSDGRRTGAIEFTTLVYDPDGNLLNMSDKRVSMNLSPDTYKRFISTPVRFQLQVSAPVKQQSFMRVIIRDVPSNHYGVVEISTAQVGRLPPLEAQAAPADAKPAAAATPAQPGTKQ